MYEKLTLNYNLLYHITKHFLLLSKLVFRGMKQVHQILFLVEDGRGMKLTFEFKMLNFGFLFMYDKRVTTIMLFIILHMSTMGFLARKQCCALIL